jgi:hypothetical protein
MRMRRRRVTPANDGFDDVWQPKCVYPDWLRAIAAIEEIRGDEVEASSSATKICRCRTAKRFYIIVWEVGLQYQPGHHAGEESAGILKKVVLVAVNRADLRVTRKISILAGLIASDGRKSSSGDLA